MVTYREGERRAFGDGLCGARHTAEDPLSGTGIEGLVNEEMASKSRVEAHRLVDHILDDRKAALLQLGYVCAEVHAAGGSGLLQQWGYVPANGVGDRGEIGGADRGEMRAAGLIAVRFAYL